MDKLSKWKDSKTWKINPKFFPLKGHYFFIYGAQVGFYSFLPIMAKRAGLSPSAFGVIYTIMPFFDICIAPLFSGLADKFRCWKSTCYVSLVLIGCTSFLIYFAPSAVSKPLDIMGTLQCDTDNPQLLPAMNATLPGCHAILNFCHLTCYNCSSSNFNFPDARTESDAWCNATFDLDVNVSMTTALIDVHNVTQDIGCLSSENICRISCSQGCSDPTNIYTTPTFWIFFLGIFFNWVPIVIIWNIFHAMSFEVLGDKPELYGLQRLWGSVGSGLASILGGVLVEYMTGSEEETNFLPIFVILVIFTVFDLLMVSKVEVVDPPPPKNFFKNIKNILVIPHFMGYSLAVFLLGGFLGVLWTFQFWFLKQLGATPLLVALVTFVNNFVGEIPCFFVSGWILAKIGHYLVLAISFFAFGLRYIVYSFLQNPWYVLIIEALQGPAYGLFFTSLPTYAKEMAPRGQEATAQGMIGVVFEIGLALGILSGGVIYEKYGPRATWRGYGTFSFLGGFLMLFLHYCCAPETKRKEESTETKC